MSDDPMQRDIAISMVLTSMGELGDLRTSTSES
jgi:hypothetical protein